MIPLTSKFL